MEVHVPLAARTPGTASDAYAWIDDVEEHLGGLDGSRGEEYDDGEELGDEYVFFVSGAAEPQLLDLAREVARLPRVPDGAYAVINDTAGDLGRGRRVELR